MSTKPDQVQYPERPLLLRKHGTLDTVEINRERMALKQAVRA